MRKYNNDILEMWEKYEISKLSPLLIPNSKKINETLIVGLNPSNSFQSLRSVKNRFENEWLSDKIISQIKDSISYNKFLNYKYFNKNKKSIWLIQEWCHAAHRHFIKQTDFLLRVGIKQFTFIDIFPIWCTSQKDFIKYLNNNKVVAHQLANSFIDMVYEKNITKLIFLNKEAFNQFKKYSLNNFTINYFKSIDVNKARKKNISSGVLKLGSKKIKVYSIGIGGWDNNEELAEKLFIEKFVT